MSDQPATVPTPSVLPAVCIGGCGRSGTTMLGAMLGNSPWGLVTPESGFKNELLLRDWSKAGAEGWQTAVDRFIAKDWQYRNWESPAPGIPAAFASEIAPTAATLGRVLLHCTSVYAAARGRPAGNYVWVDHSPSNLKNAPRIAAALPGTRFIHIIRDPRAIAASVMPLDWGPKSALAAAHWWIREVAIGLALETAWPERVLRVRYEDLVAEPERELRRMCGFLRAPYVETMREPKGLTLPRYNHKQHSSVGGGLDHKRLFGWRQTLSKTEVTYIESVTLEMMDSFGYERDNPRPRGPKWLARTRMALGDELWRKPYALMRYRMRRAAI